MEYCVLGGCNGNCSTRQCLLLLKRKDNIKSVCLTSNIFPFISDITWNPSTRLITTLSNNTYPRYNLYPQNRNHMISLEFVVLAAVGWFFIVDHAIDQFIYLLIEYCIKRHKVGVIWSGSKGITIGRNNTELVSDSWTTRFWTNFPLRKLKYLALKSITPTKNILLLVGLISI